MAGETVPGPSQLLDFSERLLVEAAGEIDRLRAALTEIARLGVNMPHDFSRSAAQARIARRALDP